MRVVRRFGASLPLRAEAARMRVRQELLLGGRWALDRRMLQRTLDAAGSEAQA